MDLSHLEAVFQRNADALVAVFIEGDHEQPCYLGSGVLVSLAGREFVLTAAHNVWRKADDRLAAIALGMGTTAVKALNHPGDGSAGRVRCPPALAGSDPEPDVAVIEPSPSTVLLPGRRPYLEEELQYFDPGSVSFLTPTACAGRELVATGLPVHFVDAQPGLRLSASGGTRMSLSLEVCSMRVYSIPSRADRPTFINEPVAGRGFHIYLAKQMEDGNGQKVRCDSLGMSGGPVVVPSENGTLVGLMRSRLDYQSGWDEWCEPVAEAIRLLLDHDDPLVRKAAARVVARYDVARATTE